MDNTRATTPRIDSWKSGEDLPVPVQHAMAVTWQENPVVLGGWRTEGAEREGRDRSGVAGGQRSLDGAAASVATPGGRGGRRGRRSHHRHRRRRTPTATLLNTTEIFDGTSWKLGAPIPTPRQMLGAASDGKLVYVLGGTNGTSDLATVEAYDPAADTWTSLPELPGRRSDFGVAYADGRLVVVGGMSGGQVLKSVVALDLTTQSWNGLPDMGTGRHGMAVAGVGKTVYAIGGSTGAGDGQITSSAEALKLAPRKPQPASEWRALPDAPTERLMMAWTVLDGKIWVAGGMRHGETLQTVESYDPATGVWQPQPPLPIPLHHATAATYRGEVVVIGGATENLAEASNKVFAFRDGKWVELPALQHARAAAAAAVVGDKLVVVGGQDDKQLVAPTEVFDGQSWTQAADMPTPREHLAAVSDGVYVYTVGGRISVLRRELGGLRAVRPGVRELGRSWRTCRLRAGATAPRSSMAGSWPSAARNRRACWPRSRCTTSPAGSGRTLAPIDTPRHGQAVAAVGSTVYCIGGADRPSHEGPVATVEALDFT